MSSSIKMEPRMAVPSPLGPGPLPVTIVLTSDPTSVYVSASSTAAAAVGVSSPDAFAIKLEPGAPREPSRSSSATETADADDAEGPARKKQKRNKPTLSCLECVERKTKCDRGRPHCLSCIKRQTECRYAHVANLLEETSRSAADGRRMTKPPKSKLSSGTIETKSPSQVPNIADRCITRDRLPSRGSIGMSAGLLSHVPYSHPSASNVFGIGSEHPFANYWTCAGGLGEVLDWLPNKMHSDMLMLQYFECVDPVYPMIHRQSFYASYEHFWSLSKDEKASADPALVALIFVMLAMGGQFVVDAPLDGYNYMGVYLGYLNPEAHASAANQALRVGSYLSTASIQSVQAMVLIVYFLINDNHASDGWAFAGILVRQAYAMGLHRDPDIVTSSASIFEKQLRRKLWQAVLLQDTFMTVLLALPPSTTHTDVSVDDFNDDSSSIACSDPNDMAYIRGSWTLTNLVQETICSPRSLDMPVCTTQRQKSKLIADFRAVYRSFPDIFRSWDPDSITALVATNKRVVRQTLFLTSNYYHNLMLVHASESADVPVNVRGTLEAAHEAITAFFTLYQHFENEARVWWVFNHRAFLEALCIGGILRESLKDVGIGDYDRWERDPVFARAKADITKMIHIMRIMGEGDHGSEVARTRVTVLSDFL